MKKETVLITGANGFIGASMGRLFSEKGFHVIGWDLSPSDKGLFQVESVDLSSQSCIEEALIKVNPDKIVHCAGSADVGKSVLDPYWDYQGNVSLTHNLLFAVHHLKLDNVQIVFLSSAAVYGNPESLPITESSPLNPLSPYALHKVMCEDLCHYFARNFSMDIRIARIFSAYGKGLRKQIFWDMYQKLKDTGRLDMFGSGNESRDYINVEDVLQALYLITTAPSDGEIIYNVANGEEVTIREATEQFAQCAGIDMDQIHFNGVVREGDPLNWRADITRLKGLGYQKRITIQEGLKQYYDWAHTL